MDKNSIKIKFDIARKKIDEKNFDQANILFKEIIKEDPNHFGSLFLLGTIHGLLNNFDLAIEYLLLAIKVNKDNINVHFNIAQIYKKKKNIIDRVLKNNFSKTLKAEKQNSIKENKSLASRKSSELTLNALTKENNTLIGGSADLAGSNNTKTKYHNIIKPADFNGDYIHYGVREHAMSGIMNGLALHSKLIPYGGTFLIFSDYCKPSIPDIACSLTP